MAAYKTVLVGPLGVYKNCLIGPRKGVSHTRLKTNSSVEEQALIKEVCRLIRAARSQWDAHHNAATRLARGRALRLYNTLSPEQKTEIPQVLRVWLRYRSEKYFGARKKKRKKR